MSEIFAWLQTAGGKFEEEMVRSGKTLLRFTRPVPNGMSRENMAFEATLAKHWISWKKALLGFSHEGRELSEARKRVAGRCHGLL